MNHSLRSREVVGLLAAIECTYKPVRAAKFSKHLIEVLGMLLGEGFVCGNVIDQTTGLTTSETNVAVPDRAGWSEHVSQFIGQNPIVQYTLQGGTEPVHRFSDHMTLREFRRTDLFEYGWRPVGIKHQLAVMLPLTAQQFLGLTMNRDRDFSDEDLLRLQLLAPHFARAHGNMVRLDELKRQVKRAAAVPPALNPARLHELGLTARETEVLHWLCEGKRDGEIASILNISPRTIYSHVGHLFQKLNVETRTAAASEAQRFRYGGW